MLSPVSHVRLIVGSASDCHVEQRNHQVPRVPLRDVGVTSHRRDVYRLLGERYLPLIALTDSCASPVTSPRLRPWPSSRSLCRLLSAPAANRAFSTLFCESFLGCLVPYHGGPIGCSRLLLPRCHRPSPGKVGSASRCFPRTQLFVGVISRLQTFHYVQAPKFVRPPGCTHRYG